MAVRVVKRHGERRIVIDIRYKGPNGTRERYRKDAEVQTMAAARGEERRRLAALALTGDPSSPISETDVVPEPAAPERRSARPGTSVGPKFSTVAEAYLAEYAPSALKPSTAVGYTNVIRSFLIPEIGETPIDAVDANTSRALDLVMVSRGVKSSTRRNVQTVLRSVVCRYAVEAGLISARPALSRLPKMGGTVTRAMPRADLAKLLLAAKPSEALAFLLAAYAGLRAGEIRGLRWGDVDLEGRRLVVRRAICRGHEAPPKSGHQPAVPLQDDLLSELAKRGPGPRASFVSVSERGEPWTDYGLLNAFRRACSRAGISGWRFHDLRHYFVSALFRAGVGAAAVKELAGHLHLRTTQIYAHTTESELEDAIRRLR